MSLLFLPLPSLRAKRSNPESRHRPLGCFVAALLAMTGEGVALMDRDRVS